MKFDVNKFTAGGLAKNPVDGGYSDIEFVGYMCKAAFEDYETGENLTRLFTVNADGKCTGSYNDPYLHPYFSIVNQEDKVIKNQDVVTVNRFFRRWNGALGQIESHGGLTAIIEMNYDTRLMTVYPAFCSDEENFSKDIGLMYASSSEMMKQGILFKFDKEMSIYENLRIAVLSGKYFFTDGMQNLPNMQGMFIRNLNRLFNPIDDKTAIIGGKKP